MNREQLYEAIATILFFGAIAVGRHLRDARKKDDGAKPVLAQPAATPDQLWTLLQSLQAGWREERAELMQRIKNLETMLWRYVQRFGSLDEDNKA